MVLLEIEQGAKLSKLIDSLFSQGAELGWTLIKALLVFIIGKLLINLVNKLITRILLKRDIDPSVKTFVGSLVNVVLMVLLIVSVVGALGVQTTSFAALLASAGVAVGMALSGNLSNFAGGLIILLLRPYKVGDYIAAQGVEGSVKAIQIFHTVLLTIDNKVIYIPNGSLSGGVVTNYSSQEFRRVDLKIGVEYDIDFRHVKQVLEDIIAHDTRILQTPAAPQVLLSELADSSVNIAVRLWVKSADYWDVFFSMNQTVYERFNQEGIGFPFPQLTIHQAQN
ncbi:MAG TPA: mechanosensitive ion channel protein MscS [Parabacteroides sp.]|nr:mechanosensitive ion channel protein MscS [Parabacteroides sp.]